jgi:hypothetical protein
MEYMDYPRIAPTNKYKNAGYPLRRSYGDWFVGFSGIPSLLALP